MGIKSVKEDGTVQQVQLDIRSKSTKAFNNVFICICKTVKTQWLSQGLKVRVLSITWCLLYWWYHKLCNLGSPQWLFLRLKWSKGGLIGVVPSTCIKTINSHVWSCWLELSVAGSELEWKLLGMDVLLVYNYVLDNCFPVVAFWVSRPQVTWTHVPWIWRKQQHSPLY